MRTPLGLAVATFGSPSRERQMPSPQRAPRASSRGNHIRALSGLLLIITLPTATSAAAQWTNSASKDEMTNEQMVLAISPHATPSRPMELPYTDTDAWVGFMCDGKNEWVYLGFSNTPNLNNTELGDGFNYFSTRLKWGAEIKNARFSQKWGSSFINFSDGRDALKRLTNGSADTLLLELDWYGNGAVYFRFSLEGAADAIAKARASCKK